MINKQMIVVAAVVIAAALGVGYYLHSRGRQAPHTPAAAQPAPPAAPQEPAIEHPVPPATGESQGPLPALGESDPAIKDALSEVVGSDAVAQYLVPDNIIRHIVVTVDNLPRQKVPVEKRPTVMVAGTFLATGDELHARLDPRNFARYEPMVGVVSKLDMQRLAQVYLHFYPLFQHVYQDLGYPNGYFNDRLVEVIDSLLATPEPRGPIELTRPNVMYTFADPTLESRPAGQKLLLRMGRDNAAAIKAKLRELRAIVTAAPPPKH
ncbi:MAG: DUF3014 domain-containing protein [Steroidobacteraceae bacterium]